MSERNGLLASIILLCGLLLSCARRAEAQAPAPAAQVDPRAARVESAAEVLPPDVRSVFLSAFRASPGRLYSLLEQAEAESAAAGGLLILVDKAHPLPESHAPADLADLDLAGIPVTKPGMRLRRPALDALARMVAAAGTEGVGLVIGSAYRSYAYQLDLFARNVAAYGEAEASRFSARAGRSQHQLGTAVDFSPIDDVFADTAAGRWVAANAGRFGFSLSFPEGMEAVTGYVWESWHWRFVGMAGVALQDGFFGGVQQFFLEFYAAWEAAR